jgi:peroxidase
MLYRFAQRLDKDGTSIPAGPVDSNAVLQPGRTYPDYLQEGMDAILRGMLVTPAQKHGVLLDEGLRSVDPELSYGIAGDLNDLMATHINRGRDRGLPAYDKIRSAIGLSPVTNFTDITSDVQLQIDLASVYSSVSDVDPIIGMLAEDRVAGSLFGPTAMALWEVQFTTIRDADRFWYQHAMEHSPGLRDAMRWVGLKIDDDAGPWVLNRTLADLILDTTSLGGPGDIIQFDEDSSALFVQ